MKRALLALGLVACQGGGTAGPGDAAKRPRDASVPAPDAASADAGVQEPDQPPDPERHIADLGAISAWQAVIDRAQYLGRRKQHGIVYGTIGAEAAPYVWLVDDSEGNGSLGIPALLGNHPAAKGDRVAVGGAWELDASRKYFWKVDSLEKLPPAKTDLKDPPQAIPSHAIGSGELPSGARTVSLAKDDSAVYFQIVGPAPKVDGDGWAVADELGNPTAAYLNLPGERASYGAQDMRTTDERWVLKRGVTYWVRIGKVHQKAAGKPFVINARTAPIRVL